MINTIAITLSHKIFDSSQLGKCLITYPKRSVLISSIRRSAVMNSTRLLRLALYTNFRAYIICMIFFSANDTSLIFYGQYASIISRYRYINSNYYVIFLKLGYKRFELDFGVHSGVLYSKLRSTTFSVFAFDKFLKIQTTTFYNIYSLVRLLLIYS